VQSNTLRLGIIERMSLKYKLAQNIT